MTPAEHLATTVRRAFDKLGFAFFDEGSWNVNYIGVRGPEQRAGRFDDLAMLLWREAKDWRAFLAPFTTDPGRTYLNKPINVKGTAILASPQQMRGAYKMGIHRGYRALVQAKAVRVWRDDNRDDILDWGDGLGIPGWYGIHHHRGAPEGISAKTDYYSAGCQVYQLIYMFLAMMDIMAKTMARYGKVVTYTLVDAKELGLKL
jgi:hypothetical protein